MTFFVPKNRALWTPAQVLNLTLGFHFDEPYGIPSVSAGDQDIRHSEMLARIWAAWINRLRRTMDALSHNGGILAREHVIFPTNLLIA